MQREQVTIILYSIFLICLIPAGITLIWYYSCWQVALGIFLIIWGNNISDYRSKNKK